MGGIERSVVVLILGLSTACSGSGGGGSAGTGETDTAPTGDATSHAGSDASGVETGSSGEGLDGTADDTGDTTGGEEPSGVWINGENLETPRTRPFSEVPAPGVHPRILLSPEDLPERRAAAQDEGSVAWVGMERLRARSSETLDDPSSEIGGAYQLALVGGLNAPSDELLGTGNVGIYGTGTAGLYGALAAAGWVALIEEDEARGVELARALGAVAAAHDAIYEPDLGNALAHDANADLGLAYDFLHPYMEPADRAAVRGLLSRMTTGRQAYGVGMSAAAVSTNWRTHHDHIVIAALAIEGEEGYDPEVYESNVDKLDLFSSAYGVTSSGMPHEGLAYYAFGMHWGAMSMLATARRGVNLFETTHFYRSLHYALREMAPWGEGQVFGHADGGGWATGTGASSFYTIIKYAWPEDALADYVTRENRAHGRQDRIPLMEAMFGVEPLPVSPSPESIATELELPLTLYSPLKGYAYARSDWGPDALRLDFDARSDLWDLGHIHADRNGFTMAALGRRWVFDPGYHMEFNDLHSTVLIDGIGQSGTSTDEVQLWPPMPAQLVELRDDGDLFVAAGDATAAYSLARPRGERLPDTGLTWADFLHDPAYLAEHHAGPVDARDYNPVLFAYRTVALVRGPHPFVVIADDIQKDDQPHTYQWIFNTRGAYPWNQLTMVLEPDATATRAILRHEQDTDPGTPRLLVEVLSADGDTLPIALEDADLTASSGVPHTHRRFLVERSQTVAPDFRIALIPFRAGDPLPQIDYDGTHLTVTQADTAEELTFTKVGDRTHID
ncbi:MAG: hypothetical protein AAF799_00175 [Myxococcota bacterium]